MVPSRSSWLRACIFVLCLFNIQNVIITSPAIAVTNDNNGKEKSAKYTSEVRRDAAMLIYELKAERSHKLEDLRYFMNLAKKLESYRFTEVVDALLFRLNIEVNLIEPYEKSIKVSGKELVYSNLQLVDTLVVTLGNMALADSLDELEKIKTALVNKIETIKSPRQGELAREVKDNLEQAIMAVSINSGRLEPLGDKILKEVREGLEEAEQVVSTKIKNEEKREGGPKGREGEESSNVSGLPVIRDELSKPYLNEQLKYLAENDKTAEAAIKIIGSLVVQINTDTIKRNSSDGTDEIIVGRDKEAERVIDILARSRGGHPAIVGSSFSGKTAVIKKVVKKLLYGEYPQVEAYKRSFDNVYVIEVSALSILSSQNPSVLIKQFLNALHFLKTKHNINIITYLTDLEKLKPERIADFESAFLASDGPKFILESDSADFIAGFKDLPRIKALIEEVPVKPLSKSEVKDVLATNLKSEYESKFNVTYDDLALDAIILEAKSAFGDLGTVEGSNRFMQDLSIYYLRQQGEGVVITAEMVRQYVESVNIKNDNPLDDLELMERLTGLLSYLNQRIYGWEETNEAVSDAVFAHMTQPSRDRKAPLSMFLIGSTGTGKSEMAKALAYQLFGSEKAALILNMGAITSEHEKSKLFGAPPGYTGYGVLTEFEKFLEAHEETGAVILWDEVSNMGGSKPEMKETLFKILYDLVEEGQFTSPSKSTPYDLSKFVFVFTGNDGEQLFQGVSADDMRIAIWLESNRKEQLKELLRKSGVPEAFIGRMADLILAKPLTVKVMKKITLKFLEPLIQHYKKLNVNVVYDDALLEQFAESFFAQSTGARSVRTIIEQRLRSYVAQVHWYAQENGFKDKPIDIKFSIDDNLPKDAFTEDAAYKREIKITVIAESDGEEVTRLEKNVTDFAPKKRRLSPEQATLTAFHEAGHAAANIPDATGEKIAFLTIMGEDDYLGYARWSKVSDDVYSKNLTKKMLLNKMARSLAGNRAQMLAGFEPDAGWSGDISNVRSLAYRWFTEFGDPEDSSMLAIPVDKDGVPVIVGELQKKLQSKIEALVAEADELAIKILLERWSLVEGLAHKLIRDGNFSGDEHDLILESLKGDKREWEIGSQGRAVEKGSESLLTKVKARVLGKKSQIPVVKLKKLPGMTPEELTEVARLAALANVDILGEREKIVIEDENVAGQSVKGSECNSILSGANHEGPATD